MKEKILKEVSKKVPLSDRVMVLPYEVEKTTSTGLLKADTKIGEDTMQVGKVIAIGKGRYSENGELLPMQVSVGDEVTFSRHAGDKIFYDENLNAHPGIGDKRDEWLAIVILRQDAILLH